MTDEMTSRQDAEAVQRYWHWYGVPTLLGCPYRHDFDETNIGLIGFPYSGGNASAMPR